MTSSFLLPNSQSSRPSFEGKLANRTTEDPIARFEHGRQRLCNFKVTDVLVGVLRVSGATADYTSHVRHIVHPDGGINQVLHIHTVTGVFGDQTSIPDHIDPVLLSGPSFARDFANHLGGNWNPFDPVVNDFLFRQTILPLELRLS